jgi:glycerol-3-phosphate dehydrogenase
MHQAFSSRHRPEYLRQLTQTTWDLLVIGGGITGAGILLDAQTRGMKTALLDMQDFAAGTSSRSTKLIHGGLRYLKQLEFKLVAEVGRERAIVYENGPHVTRAEPMLLPLLKGGSLGKLSASMGLMVYDWLAEVEESEKRRMLSAEETADKEPLLSKERLIGGAYYYEYRTDDARLTLEIIKEAVGRGATALNYLKVNGFLYEGNQIAGVNATDQLTGQTHQTFARKIVNATGPWVDTLDSFDKTARTNKLYLTKGVHIVIDWKKLPLRQSVYFDAPDGRMVFAIPREGKTYVGTTDTAYTGELANPPMTDEDRSYLLNTIQYMFPAVQLSTADIESNWVGLRPLIRQEGKGPTEISRKDEIFQYPSGLITIAGGKLTGYRKMAQRIVDIVAAFLQKSEGRTFPGCITDRIPVSGGKVGGAAQFPAFIAQQIPLGESIGVNPAEARQLAQMYGSNTEHLFGIIRQHGAEAEHYQLPLTVFAQLRYSLDAELVATPADFFIRRTGALYFNIDWVRQWQEPVMVYMADYFRWTAEQTAHFRQQLETYLHLAGGPVRSANV